MLYQPKVINAAHFSKKSRTKSCAKASHKYLKSVNIDIKQYFGEKPYLGHGGRDNQFRAKTKTMYQRDVISVSDIRYVDLIAK